MPELVLNGNMIDMLTDPAIFRQAVLNYRAQQMAKKTYYERNKERILAKKRADYHAKKVAADPPTKTDVQSV
jgi:hypothetical protein